MNWEEKLLQLLGQKSYSPLTAKQLSGQLRLPRTEYTVFLELLAHLERSGQIARIRHDRFTLPLEADLIPGRILMSRSGAGRLQPDDAHLPSLTIPADSTGTALHQDRVLVRRAPESGGEPEGKVIRILERAYSQIVGSLQRSQQFYYIIPDDPRIPHDIYVPEPTGFKPTPNVGDKVVVQLVAWPSRHNNPEGSIVQVLGPPDQPGVDIRSILCQYQLPDVFPPDVLQECRDFEPRVREADWQGRKDCRGDLVITIDPDDAKDFDDAISVQPHEKGWRLWVHIADVSHYVSPGTALDREASKRGNSTYLVDRVIPMLPESLSNDLCSLKPGVERLTKCVEFVLSPEGKPISARFYSAVIQSKRRFTYQEVLALLGKPASHDPIERMLHQAHQLAQRLRKARFAAGALDLDFPETKIRLDQHGKIESIEKVVNDVSHQLIEEFMLLANEAVAKKLKTSHKLSVYRIHEDPNQERLRELRRDLLIHQVRVGNLSKRGELQRVLLNLKSHPAGAALKVTVLRSLKRARYAIEPLGHFGLAKSDYTHFTSPIRRYADLLVHRALFQPGKLSRQEMINITDHISFTERNSADAETDSKTAKLMAHLQAQLDSGKLETYAATVTEIRNFAFFVEVPALGTSGAVRVSSLEDDFYHFDRDRLRLIGRRHRRVFSVGNQVEVQVCQVDRFKKQINFSLVEAGRGKARGRRPDRERTERRREPAREEKRSQPAWAAKHPTPEQGRPQRGWTAKKGPQRAWDSNRPKPQQASPQRAWGANQPKPEQKGAQPAWGSVQPKPQQGPSSHRGSRRQRPAQFRVEPDAHGQPRRQKQHRQHRRPRPGGSFPKGRQ